MKRNAPGFVNSPLANIALASLLVLNPVIITQVLAYAGFVSIFAGAYQRKYRNWEFETEKNVREWIVPRLVQENGLKECPVKHKTFGCTHFKIDAASPDQYAKITENVIRLEQETREDREWRGSFILEFDHDKPGHGISVFLYTGRASSSGMLDQWRTNSFWRVSR